MTGSLTGKTIDRLTSAGVFLYALIVYLITIAETTSFWDSGEFIASVQGLQVMHPPGAPFYLLVGNFFTHLAPIFSGFTPEPVAFSVALVSALASAFTVLLTHLVIVRLARIWKGAPTTWSTGDRLAVNGGGVVGALTFAVTDSFWFNAVEAEVYALSMLFTALVIWLALRWREATLSEEAEIRARGEHPFGLRADRNLLLIAYLFGLAIGVHLLNLLAIFFVALIVFFTKFEKAEWTVAQRWGGIAAAGVVSAIAFFTIYPGIIQWLPEIADSLNAPVAFFVVLPAAIVGLVAWTQRSRRPVANLIALAFAFVMLGYSSYGIIPIRSAADPAIDLNNPETADAFVSYLKREQYGSTPLLTGETYDNRTGRFTETTLPRRYSYDPSHIQVYEQYNSDLDYFLGYQMGHMYWRYFMWQFVGKNGDTQDTGWRILPASAETLDALTPSEKEGFNAYFALPLLLGLFGMLYHFSSDWRRAFAVGILFLVTGIGIILYLNQPPNQPRERDYSYVASFFAFSLWIGIGATGLIELTAEQLRGKASGLSRGATWAVAVLVFAAVPGWMLLQNFDDHDRSGRRIATDFAYNMLQSTAEDAIVFTNGDNDTYPLWYLQEVMGVRPDVRVVNLSLLQTPWYIEQLKTQAERRGAAKPVPMTLSEEQIRTLEPAIGFQPRVFSVPGAIPDSTISWRVEGRGAGQQRYLLTSDLAVLSIIDQVAREGWERPVYFASTVAQDSELGLQPFFRNEGLARRILPERHTSRDPDGTINPEIITERLATWRYRNLADPGVYYDENARNMADSYRSKVASIARLLAEQGHTAQATNLLDRVREEVPFTTIPAGIGSLYAMAEAYRALDAPEAMLAVLQRAETDALSQYEKASTPAAQDHALQIIQFVQGAYLVSGQYEAASDFYNRLADMLGDDRLRLSPEQLREEAQAMEAAQQQSQEMQQQAPQAPPPAPDSLADPASGS